MTAYLCIDDPPLAWTLLIFAMVGCFTTVLLLVARCFNISFTPVTETDLNQQVDALDLDKIISSIEVKHNPNNTQE